MCCGQKLFYNIDIRGIFKQTRVVLGERVNGFTVNNTGTTILIFNSEPIQPGQSKTVGGNQGEEYVGRCDINFQVPVPAPPTIVNAGYVTIKYYVDGKGFDKMKKGEQ